MQRRRLNSLLEMWDGATRSEQMLFYLLTLDDLRRLVSGRTVAGPLPMLHEMDAPPALVELVETHGLSMAEVGRRLSVSDRSVRRWWRGHHRPHERHRRGLEDLLLRVRAERSEEQSA